jgi:hypothetical protein
MNTTNPSTQINLSIADDGSKRLAIIYGTLGTLLALASLAFAALTWARSRRHQCQLDSKTRTTTDRALESNELGSDAREAYELEGSVVADAPIAVSRFVTSKSKDVDNCLLFIVQNKKRYPNSPSPKPSRTTLRALLSSRSCRMPFRDGKIRSCRPFVERSTDQWPGTVEENCEGEDQ